jgi:hypothetical protein
MRCLLLTFILCGCMFFSGRAYEPSDSSKGITIADRHVALNFAGAVDIGQLVAYQFRGAELNHAWLQRTKICLSGSTKINEKTSISFGVQGLSWYETYDKFSNNPFMIPDRYYTFIIDHSEIIYSLNSLLSIEFGVLNFKYNPEVRNLGEYLFRSGCYPGFLIGDFDYPLARVTGLRLHNTLFDGTLKQDFLATMETQYKPFHDISLTYLAKVTPKPFVTLGGGIQFAHLISVDESATTPPAAGGQYAIIKDTIRGSNGQDSLFLNDTISLPDTSTVLTFRGIKLMARACIDFKKLFPWDKFGNEDLKLYGEAAILGVKDYKLYYNNLIQRIPIMVGFNLPAFKMLDLISCEVEWYGSPYPNNYLNAFSITPLPRPIPDGPASGYSMSTYTKDNWKWSVYVKKSLSKSFSIIGQAARDHFRTVSIDPYNVEREEALTKTNHWYWTIRFGYGF